MWRLANERVSPPVGCHEPTLEKERDDQHMRERTLHEEDLLPDDGVEGLVRADGLEEDDDGDSSRVELTIAVTEEQ